MVRKLFSSILCVTLIVFIAGCKPSAPMSTEYSGNKLSPSATPIEPSASTSASDTAAGQIGVDKNLLTVELIFPASYFEDLNANTFDSEAYIKENDFLSAKVQEDGSVSVLMTKSRHEELLNELSVSINSTITDYKNSLAYPYIKDIEHNEDYSSFTMKVNRKGYESDICFAETTLVINVAFYHMIAGIDTKIQFTTIDFDTGEIITSNSH